MTDRDHHSFNLRTPAKSTGYLPAAAKIAKPNEMTSESSLCDSDMSIQPSQLIEPPILNKHYEPLQAELECTEPTFSSSEFSSPSVYLNECSSKKFFSKELSIDKRSLMNKVALFERYQNLEFNKNHIEYTDQYLAIAISNYNFDSICGEKKSVFLKPVQDFCAIKKIILIPRSKVPIAYCIDNLGKQYHGTVLENETSFKTFLSIFDHIPVQRIHYESCGFFRRKSGIDIRSSHHDAAIAKLSERLW
jgi:hypothetical protein